MSESKIRKVRTGALRPGYGPATAGLFFDATDGTLRVNPDGTERVFADSAKAQTLTNKTLTSPVLNTPTISAPVVSSSPTGGDGVERWIEVALTNAQIKALRATPVEVIPAPGAGKVIEITSCVALLDYGSNALTSQASDANITLKRKDASGCILVTGGLQAFLQATADGVEVMRTPSTTVFDSKTQAENQAIVAHNASAGEIAGNAAADTVIRLKIGYRVWTTGF